MDVSLLGVIAWWKQLLVVVFAVVCVLLIILVLLQKGRGGGLSAAFGGAGGQSAFGSKTGDVFTWVTIVAAGVFLLLAIASSYFWVPEDPDKLMDSSRVESSNSSEPAKPDLPSPPSELPTQPEETVPVTGDGAAAADEATAPATEPATDGGSEE